jgi:hypothetical protein
MVELIIGLVLGSVALLVFLLLLKTMQRLSKPAEMDNEAAKTQDAEALEPIEPEGEIGTDGLLYMFAGKFVRPVGRRSLGSIPRDRAFDLATGDELEPLDFAMQMVSAVLTDLLSEGYIRQRLIECEPTFMPPFPHKTWEMQLSQEKTFCATPLYDSLNIAFEMIYKKRMRRAQVDSLEELAGTTPDALWVGLDELLENALKAMRQEMRFWERGCIYSDLRNYVGIGLTAQRFLLEPSHDTWLERVRSKGPLLNTHAVSILRLEEAADALSERIQAFRNRHGSAEALGDPRWPSGEVDPGLVRPRVPLNELPLDDCLRLSVYETLIAIRQLEPSGEAGI